MSDLVDSSDTANKQGNNQSRVWLIVLVVLLVILFCCCAAVLLFYFVIGDVILRVINDISNQMGMFYY